MTQVSFFRIVLLVIVFGMVGACSSTHPYKNNSPDNMTISTDVHRGAVQLHVFEVDNGCEMTYQGTVDLTVKTAKVALPINKPILLAFNFTATSLLIGSNSNSYDMYLTLHKGSQYDALVSYADDMYGVTIYEQNMVSGGRSKIPHARPPCALK